MEEAEARKLFDVALEAAGMGPVLEIGSYCGKSSYLIGMAAKQRDSILFCVDHHQGSEEQQPGEEYFDESLYDETTGGIETFRFFRDTIARSSLADTVVPIVAPSETVGRCWQTPLSMVFVDGGHSFKDAFTDYETWSGHIMHNGFLVFHDIFLDPAKGGPAPGEVYELVLKDDRFTFISMTHTLAVFQRTGMRQKD